MEIVKIERHELGGFAKLCFSDGSKVIVSLKESYQIEDESEFYLQIEVV